MPVLNNNNTSSSTDATRRRINRLAYWLDSAIPLPGGKSIGFESIIGIIPGVGDLLGALASGYIIVEGIKLGAPRNVVLKMVLNVALESTIGMVPIIGDVFDIFYKSNQRNVDLLRSMDETSTPPDQNKRWLRAAKIIAILILLAGLAWLAYRITMWVASTALSLF